MLNGANTLWEQNAFKQMASFEWNNEKPEEYKIPPFQSTKTKISPTAKTKLFYAKKTASRLQTN